MLHVGTTIRPGENINFSFDEKGEAYINAKGGGGGGGTWQELYAGSVANGFEGTYDDWLREYLGPQTELPWCSGYFQDTSLTANTLKRIIPIFEEGFASMVSGDALVAPDDGWYAFNTTRSVVPTSGMQRITVNTPRGQCAFYAEGADIPSISHIARLSKGQSFTVDLRSSVAQSTIKQNNQIIKFTFVRILQGVT